MNIYVYIGAMALTTYLIRMLPLTIFRRPIKSRFLRSFLYYVPYACLTAMTFPAILTGAGVSGQGPGRCRPQQQRGGIPYQPDLRAAVTPAFPWKRKAFVANPRVSSP